MEVINTGRVVKNIIDAYVQLRDKVDVSRLERFNIVILMQPKTFIELRSELNGDIKRDKDLGVNFIYIFGRATPVIINDELPEDVEFQMMTQQDYERMEKEEMFRRFDKMFFEN